MGAGAIAFESLLLPKKAVDRTREGPWAAMLALALLWVGWVGTYIFYYQTTPGADIVNLLTSRHGVSPSESAKLTHILSPVFLSLGASMNLVWNYAICVAVLSVVLYSAAGLSGSVRPDAPLLVAAASATLLPGALDLVGTWLGMALNPAVGLKPEEANVLNLRPLIEAAFGQWSGLRFIEITATLPWRLAIFYFALRALGGLGPRAARWIAVAPFVLWYGFLTLALLALGL